MKQKKQQQEQTVIGLKPIQRLWVPEAFLDIFSRQPQREYLAKCVHYLPVSFYTQQVTQWGKEAGELRGELYALQIKLQVSAEKLKKARTALKEQKQKYFWKGKKDAKAERKLRAN